MSHFTLVAYSPFSWKDIKDDLKRLVGSPRFVLACDDGNVYEFSLSEGLLWDGASIPAAFRWFLPNIDPLNLAYTAAGLLHDFCYGSECLPKDKADDLFRGVMRDAGISRFKAGVADFAVRHFGASHYGQKNDRLEIRYFGRMTIRSEA